MHACARANVDDDISASGVSYQSLYRRCGRRCVNGKTGSMRIQSLGCVVHGLLDGLAENALAEVGAAHVELAATALPAGKSRATAGESVSLRLAMTGDRR